MSESTVSPRFWIPVTVLFAAVTLTVPLTCRSRKRPPDNVPALVEQLQAAQPAWRTEPAPGDPHMTRSVFLAIPGFSKENFPPLRVPADDARWRGLVFVEARGTQSQLEPLILESWGERVLVVGDFTFYGDRSMLRIIRQLFPAS